MEGLNGFLVRTLSGPMRVMEFWLDKSWQGESDYHIYVPGRFVCGNFKKKEDGLVLSPDGRFYKDSSMDMQKYQEDIDRGALQVVESMAIPDDCLDSIVSQYRNYINAQEQMAETARSLDKYFISLDKQVI